MSSPNKTNSETVRSPQMRKPLRPAVAFTDADGHACVGLTLPNGVMAMVDADFWDGFTANFGPVNVHCTSGRGGRYVAFNAPKGTSRMLARRVLGAGSCEMVKYIDGNPLNLRRSNLEVVNKPAKRVGQSVSADFIDAPTALRAQAARYFAKAVALTQRAEAIEAAAR